MKAWQWISFVAAMVSGGCVSPHGGAAVDVDARVFASDRGEGVKELWVVAAGSGRKLEPLLDGASLDYRVDFSPSKEWLAVEDRVVDTFTTVRLFHQEATGGFRRVPDEEFILGPWRRFLAENALGHGEVTASESRVDGWDEGRLRLVLKATKADGKVLTKRVEVALAELE